MNTNKWIEEYRQSLKQKIEGKRDNHNTSWCDSYCIDCAYNEALDDILKLLEEA